VNDRKNLINLAVFLLVALLSTLLIMAAISMLDLRGNGSPGGENNKRAYQNDGSGKNRNKQDRNNNNKNKKEAAKGRMTTVPTGRKGLKEGVAREEVLTGEIMLMGKDPKA